MSLFVRTTSTISEPSQVNKIDVDKEPQQFMGKSVIREVIVSKRKAEIYRSLRPFLEYPLYYILNSLVFQFYFLSLHSPLKIVSQHSVQYFPMIYTSGDSVYANTRSASIRFHYLSNVQRKSFS